MVGTKVIELKVTGTISVLVPSFGRPEALRLCLAALAEQSRKPDQVVVVTRATDSESRAVVKTALRERDLDVYEKVVHLPGQVRALIAGCAAARGDVIAITDDDAQPRPDWLERIQELFEDPKVLGVGGRDVISGEVQPLRTTVGKVRWYGKVIGNHHVGCGPIRDVDVLKGVNMAFRRAALLEHGFDSRLRGRGAQVHNDLKLSLTLRSAGGRLRYDPALLVDHIPAVRPAGDVRGKASFDQLTDAVHNETFALLEFLPAHRRYVFLVWGLLIGRQPAIGVVRMILRCCRRPGGSAWRDGVATLRGRLAGWETYKNCRSREIKRTGD